VQSRPLSRADGKRPPSRRGAEDLNSDALLETHSRPAIMNYLACPNDGEAEATAIT